MAVQVHSGLFVGSGMDLYKFSGSILHCAKSPWYDNIAEILRYWPQAPLVAWMPRLYGKPQINESNTVAIISYNEMALNMVDADHAKYFSDEMVNAGLEFITERMAEGDPILVHCNMGLSRSPSVAFLWLYEHGFLDDEFRYAVPEFRRLYPSWAPANGIWAYLKNRCESPENGNAGTSTQDTCKKDENNT